MDPIGEDLVGKGGRRIIPNGRVREGKQIRVVVVTGALAAKVGHALGIGSAAVTAWNIAKWPVLLLPGE